MATMLVNKSSRGGGGVHQLPLYHGGSVDLRVRPRVKRVYNFIIQRLKQGVIFWINAKGSEGKRLVVHLNLPFF